MSTRNETMVAALRRERAAYRSQGKSERVAQVDEQLRLLGHDPDETDSGSVAPEGRTPADPGRQTAETAAPQDRGAEQDDGQEDGEQAPAPETKPAARRRAKAKE
ncbi:hypothetical protein ACIBJC_15280 [Streptomyces sp. NPDC050509]|uniref:hypothetical protein n=1 Tax=Streptomyces sp. NPDC050509 TaxID=3365620 RepID=UPI0037951408